MTLIISKLKSLVLILTGLALLIPALGFAQNSDAAMAPVGGTIVVPLVLEFLSPMEFGSFTAGDAGGTVFIIPDGSIVGVRDKTGTVLLLGTGSPHSHAQAQVSGETGRMYSIKLPIVPIILDNNPFGPPGIGDSTMELDTFQSFTDKMGTISNQAVLDNMTGIDIFSIGGTLHVGGNQAPGEYNGTYDVTITYN